MLAEPRRKIKLSVDPRNTNWTNDDSKVGQKLMEKMGWSKGRGLGANEDGKTESIAVSLKNNTRGVGWSKKTEDNWIAHQDDFTALLSSLNEDHGTGITLADESEPHKVMKLEDTSRSSKGRVHYQKFTKGKDLSLRSKTDLNCVFGKRKSKTDENTAQLLLDQIKSDNEAREDKAYDEGGLKTITSSDSVQDYFAKKMASLKSKRDTGSVMNDSLGGEESGIETNNTDGNGNGASDIKKAKKKKRKIDEEDLKVKFSVGDDKSDDSDEIKLEPVEKKKRKKDLRVRFSLGEYEPDKPDEIKVEPVEVKAEPVDSNENVTVDNTDIVVKKKKKKKSKKNNGDIINELDAELQERDESEKSADIKLEPVEVKDEGILEPGKDEVTVETTDIIVKKKKKKSKKNKFLKEDAEHVKNELDDQAEPETSSKDGKKRKKNPLLEEDVPVKKLKMDQNISNVQDDINENKESEMDLQEANPNDEKESVQKESSEKKKSKKKKGAKGSEAVLLRYATAVKEEVNFVMSCEGPEHKPIFNMHATLGSRAFGTVQYPTKKAAKREAASVALNVLKEEGKLDVLEKPKTVKMAKPGSGNGGRNSTTAEWNGGTSRFHKSSLETLQGYPGFPVQFDKQPKNGLSGGQKARFSSSKNRQNVSNKQGQGRKGALQTPSQKTHIKF